jgi:hypothetical protein
MFVKLSELKIGDIVIHNGVEKTVTKRNLKYSKFMGTTFEGDSYNLGTKLIQKVR